MTDGIVKLTQDGSDAYIVHSDILSGKLVFAGRVRKENSWKNGRPVFVWFARAVDGTRTAGPFPTRKAAIKALF